MIRYFLGEDTYAARQEIDMLAKQTKASIRWIDKEETDKLSYTDWLPQGNNSLFGVQMTVLRDVSKWPIATQAVLAEACRKKSVNNCIIWDRVKPDKRLGLYKALRPHAKEFLPLSRPQLVSWLIAEARQRGGEIDQVAAGIMVDRLGVERWQLLSELEKMLLNNSVVSKEIVEKAIVVVNVQVEIFAMLDAISAGHLTRAVSVLDDLLASGEPELRILATIATQFRSFLLVQEGVSQGKNKDQIAKEAGLHPFVVQKSMAAAGRYKREYLLDVLTRAMATDFAIKQGKIDMRTALVMFVLSLVK